MGTTRIKVIDLSSEKQVKTARKHAEKLTGMGKLKEKPSASVSSAAPSVSSTVARKPATTQNTEKITTTEITETMEKPSASASSVSPSVSSVVARKTRQHHLGKKYKQASDLVDKTKIYPAKEAIDLLYKTSYTSFDPTVEVHLNVIDKNIRGSVNLPHQMGKKKEKRYLIFSDKRSAVSDKHIIWGDQNSIAEIESGKLKPQRDFDLVISEPKYMQELAKVAKILGPRGMMPNPKNQTITTDPQSFLKSQDQGNLEFRSDPTTPVIHSVFGKLSHKPEQLLENLKALVKIIGPTKIKKGIVSSTMGPAIKVDLTTLTG